MGFQKYKNFFPQKVYRCSCLDTVIVSCLVDGIYSLADFCDKISKTNFTPSQKLYCAKCGDNKQDVIFSCADHMAMIIIAVKRYDCTKSPDKSTASIYFYDETKTYCRGCVKKYLQEMYYYYRHINFDLPLGTKTRKRKLK